MESLGLNYVKDFEGSTQVYDHFLSQTFDDPDSDSL